MRIPENRHRGSSQPNMTPMIDVVFLLIIFFLVSSHLAKQEVQAEVNLPSADEGQKPPEVDRPRVTVNIVPAGDDYSVRLGSRPVDLEELGRRLKVERERVGKDLEVRIRSDRKVPYRIIAPILVTCSKTGIWNVGFSVIRREDDR